MKRLTVALIVSIVFHLVLVLSILVFFNQTIAPLVGGGGGEVSVEIMGEESQSSKLEAGWPRLSRGDQEKQDPPRLTAMGERNPQEASRRQVGLGTGEGSGLGSGPSGQSQVLAEIRARIERAKRYPLLARKMGLAGTSLLRFQIDAEGQPSSVSLKSSSGQKILDDAAIETIRRAGPYPTYPEPLEIGIRFLLED